MTDDSKKIIIEKKMLLRDHWKVLKNEEASMSDRKISYEAIEDLSKDIKVFEPDFEVIDLQGTKYAFVKTGKKPEEMEDEGKVKWPKPVGSFGEKELQTLKKFRAIAVIDTHELHPTLATDTDKFGTIVNATIGHLINISKKS